jgi:glutamate synthase (NADPH/NADH) small chain
MNLNNPVSYIADQKGRVTKMVLQKMVLGEPDSSGRRSPVPLEGSEYEVDVDIVVVAVGVSPNPLIPASVKGLETTKWGTIKVNEQFQSSIEDIFAGGDIVRGGATVILAMGDGRKAAENMDIYIKTTLKHKSND